MADSLGDLAGVLAELERLEELFAGWSEEQRQTVEAYCRALEALHGEALRRLIRVSRADPAAMASLKKAACDEFVYAVLRRHALVQPSLNERVEAALDGVRPLLASHGGNVTLVDVSPPRVEVEMTGACGACGSSALTLRAGVEKAIRDACPEITEVLAVNGRSGLGLAGLASPFAPVRD